MTSQTLGLVLLDSSHRPVYACPEAVRVLADETNGNTRPPLSDAVAERLREILSRFPLADDRRQMWEFHTNGQPYRCIRLPLASLEQVQTDHTATAIVLTPAGPSLPDVNELAKLYNLTPREKQTLELLIEGYPTREIAARMKISASTAKTYVRMTSAKMGVAGRDELMAKLLRGGASYYDGLNND